MSLVYVTGASGAGKSTVCAELRRRGYDAFDSDEGGLARWFDDRTGAEVVLPTDPSERDDDWFSANTYRLLPETVRRLGEQVGDRTGFICGTVGNDNEIWDLFTHVISLSVDAGTLRQRLANRPDSFGSTEDELQRILTWHATVDADNARYGAVLLDAGRAVAKVVDDLLNTLDPPKSPPLDLKGELLAALLASRASMIGKLDGLSEYDRRRPLTPTGTNLLGLVKHLAGLEYGYLGEAFGRPPVVRPSWFRDDPRDEIDMWATPDESSDYITGVYRQACAHSGATIAQLDLDSPGYVAHWSEGHRDTTLGVLLIRMVAETSHHAGHADIVRELIDGRATEDDADPAVRRTRTAAVQAAADQFRL